MIEQSAFENAHGTKDPGDSRPDRRFVVVSGGLYPPGTGGPGAPCAPRDRRAEDVHPQDLQRDAIPNCLHPSNTQPLHPSPSTQFRHRRTPPRSGIGTCHGTRGFAPRPGVWPSSPASCRTRSRTRCEPIGSGNPFSAGTRSNAPPCQ